MLVIKFDKGGKTTMTPTGYPGQACRTMTDHYRKHLAGDIQSDVPTAEANEPERQVQTQRQTETH